MIRPPLSSFRSRQVVRGEVGRTLRSIRDSPREIAGIVVALRLVPLAVGCVGDAFILGTSIVNAPADARLAPFARNGAGAVWLLATVASAFRTLATVGQLNHPDLVLAVVSIRDLVGGKLLAEATVLACWFAGPLVATVVGVVAAVALATGI